MPRGWWGAVPGGGGLPPLSGVSGVRHCPSPSRLSPGAGSWDSATRVSRVRSVRAWGPSTGPTACAVAGRRCAPWGWRKGVPGGGAVRCCEGRLGSGAPPPPPARPLGGLSGSATHVLWARVCGRGGPAPAPWLACPVGGCAPRGLRGASGFRRPLCPAASPLGGLPGPAGHVLWARVWVCAVCVVSVRCVLWCVVPPFACPSGAPLSGASVRCCARPVPLPPYFEGAGCKKEGSRQTQITKRQFTACVCTKI